MIFPGAVYYTIRTLWNYAQAVYYAQAVDVILCALVSARAIHSSQVF